ncbi:hypothetical protein EVAR_71506_1 [Eumeta japonica]|uniref:BED-type domain-containing protein n=1 Tax=Eumeta variegata TaxID=151549 RepID=A0A4C1SPC2_EUMVA|nr:hypothetical protein EVAR_71506_1 [Eumeta japonica]
MSQKNYIWDFFEKSTSDLSKAKCNKCHKLYSLGSSEPKRQTIHGLKLHLSKFHGEENRQYLKRQEKDAEKEEQKLEAKLKRRNQKFQSQQAVLIAAVVANLYKPQFSKWNKQGP